MERTIISFDYAIKDILRDKANFDILSGFLTELIERPVSVQEVLESDMDATDEYLLVATLSEFKGVHSNEVIPFSQNLNPLSEAPKKIFIPNILWQQVKS